MDTSVSIMTGPLTDIFKLLGKKTHFIELFQEHLDIDKYCSNVEDLPDITFYIDSSKYILTPQDYLLSVDKKNKPHLYQKPDSKTERCYGAFMPLNIGKFRLIGSEY